MVRIPLQAKLRPISADQNADVSFTTVVALVTTTVVNYYDRSIFRYGRVLSGLPNANAKSPRFTYAFSQIAALPPVVAPNRSSKSQIAS